ncbi:hypothetical protein N9D02_09415 [Emcibacteraceae bacterium]|nr:hypothetical protein [Emcibacteraceae bacterium]MDA9771238.1 hypothetical protein [Emcibacteraceae bacterium]MDC1090345.1 hypothetical protein [Emcibacteraceae bacterium]
MAFTFREKKLRFQKGLYKCPVPPRDISRYWTDKEWFRHVDTHGVWCL